MAADDVAQVAALAVTSVGDPAAGEVVVRVARWRPPQAGWLGTLRLADVAALVVEPTARGVDVTVRLTIPADPGLVLAGVVRLLRPTPVATSPDEITLAAGLPASAGPLAGWVRDVIVPGQSRDRHTRRCDTLVCPAAPPIDAPERTRTVVVRPDGWTVGVERYDVSVDPAVHRPVGRRSVGPWPVASYSIDGSGVEGDGGDGAVTVALPEGPLRLAGGLDSAAVRALRTVAALVGDRLPSGIAQQVNACGILTAGSPADLPDPVDALAWQAASVHARRHALRAHGPWAALDSWPSVSVVLVTHRPEQVEHAVAQVSRLAYPRLQIVLGLHGAAADADLGDLLGQIPHPTTVVTIERSATLGQALNRCSDRAEGALITKMDDDDHYGAEHIWDLVLARAYSGAQVVGKALDWIHLEQSDTTVFRPVYAAEKYGSFVAGGTMLLARADLAAVGGWRPVPKSVDRALLDRVRADGGLVYRAHGLGYVYVRRAGDRTASVRDDHFRSRTEGTFAGLVRHEALGTA